MTPTPLTTANSDPRRQEGEGPGLDGVGFLLGVAHRARRRQWEGRLADLGLTAPQAAMLRLVTAEPGQGVRRLGRRLGTDAMNAQRIVETLVAGGLCVARRDPDDARRRPYYPTDRGTLLAERVAVRARDAEVHLADTLGANTYRSLTTALRAVIEFDTKTEDRAQLGAGQDSAAAVQHTVKRSEDSVQPTCSPRGARSEETL